MGKRKRVFEFSKCESNFIAENGEPEQRTIGSRSLLGEKAGIIQIQDLLNFPSCELNFLIFIAEQKEQMIIREQVRW